MEAATETVQTKPAQTKAPGELGCRHVHRCQNCGTIWGHGNMMEADISAHKCPNCGQEEWKKFEGFQKPAPAPKPKLHWQKIVGALLIVAALLMAYRLFLRIRAGQLAAIEGGSAT